MDPVLALGLFVGIPVALAIVIAGLVMVPRKGYRADVADQVGSGGALITSSSATPNPAALTSTSSTGAGLTGGAHGNW